MQTDLAPIRPARRRWRSSVTTGELMDNVARYLGGERTRRLFEALAQERGIRLERGREVDPHILRYAEHVLASAIGAPSSRLVLSLLLQRRDVSTKQALKLLDDASEAIQHNRDVLQTALDHVGEGIAVFDADLGLICWNRRFGEVLDLPPGLVRIGAPLGQIVRFAVERGGLGDGPVERLVADNIRRMVVDMETYHARLRGSGKVLEFRTSRMPDGRLRHDLYRHHRQGALGRGAGQGQRDAGAARCASAPAS